MLISNDSPYYVKLGFKFLVIFFIGFFINIAQNILVPFAFSILLAVLMLPINNFLERRKISRVPAITLSLILSVIVIGSVIYFLSTQIANFVDDIPSIKKHLTDHFEKLQQWIKTKLHISFREQNEYLNNAAEKIKDSGTGYISNTFFSITEALMLLILLPIYTFLLLYYRDLIKKFLFAVFRREHSEKVTNVINESKKMINNYMLGLLIEMGIVAAGNSIGLMLLGVKYAIFFGVLAAVLNVIPYIGMFTATLFTVLITLTTTNSTSEIVWIVVVMYGIHIIDVNILMPKIVGSKVRINALISILGVIIGGALTGLSGLFLSVPAVALIKIICDQLEDLKPWGMLLGDDITPTKKYKLYQRLSKKESIQTQVPHS
jgi:predicted PurR-regulated permease PerM